MASFVLLGMLMAGCLSTPVDDAEIPVFTGESWTFETASARIHIQIGHQSRIFSPDLSAKVNAWPIHVSISSTGVRAVNVTQWIGSSSGALVGELLECGSPSSNATGDRIDCGDRSKLIAGSAGRGALWGLTSFWGGERFEGTLQSPGRIVEYEPAAASETHSCPSWEKARYEASAMGRRLGTWASHELRWLAICPDEALPRAFELSDAPSRFFGLEGTDGIFVQTQHVVAPGSRPIRWEVAGLTETDQRQSIGRTPTPCAPWPALGHASVEEPSVIHELLVEQNSSYREATARGVSLESVSSSPRGETTTIASSSTTYRFALTWREANHTRISAIATYRTGDTLLTGGSQQVELDLLNVAPLTPDGWVPGCTNYTIAQLYEPWRERLDAKAGPAPVSIRHTFPRHPGTLLDNVVRSSGHTLALRFPDPATPAGGVSSTAPLTVHVDALDGFPLMIDVPASIPYSWD